jgi:hypothetical protein
VKKTPATISGTETIASPASIPANRLISAKRGVRVV